MNTCSDVLSTTAMKAFITSSRSWRVYARDLMWLRVVVNKGNWVYKERNDWGTSENLKAKSRCRERTLVLRSTSEAIEATSPMMAIPSAMSAILMFNERNGVYMDVHHIQ